MTSVPQMEKGQFNDALQFAEAERVPTLSDLVLFLKANNNDGRFWSVPQTVGSCPD